MKKILLSVIVIIIFFSSNKENESFQDEKEPVLLLENDIAPQMRPAMGLTYTLSNNIIYLRWQKKGKQSYELWKKTDNIFIKVLTCSCGYYEEKLSEGTYTYKVRSTSSGDFSNEVTVVIGPPPPSPPPLPDIVKISLDEYYMGGSGWWFGYIRDTLLRGSGLEQWKRDSIMNRVRKAFEIYSITFVNSGTATHTVVVTEDYTWYPAQASGVAFIDSYGTGNESFVFSSQLYYDWIYIAKAIIHELGHAFGLNHTQDLGLITNWMSYAFVYWLQNFETAVIDSYNNLVNQIQVIINKLS
jgi:hypothetical protein